MSTPQAMAALGATMLIVESHTAQAARKMSILMVTAYVLSVSLGLLLTMHFYVRPKPPAPIGWRFFGFPRPER